MVKFTDLHDKAVQYDKGLINRIDFNKWLDENLNIKNYIPITDKYIILKDFARNFEEECRRYKEEDTINIDYVYMMYDVYILFEVLFKYTDVTPLNKHKNVKIYDIVMRTGIYDYILNRCGTDYERFLKLCDRNTGIDTMAISIELASAFGEPMSVEDYEKVAKIMNNIDTEKLKHMAEIEKMNDPTLAKVVDTIKKDAAKTSMEQAKGSGE